MTDRNRLKPFAVFTVPVELTTLNAACHPHATIGSDSDTSRINGNGRFRLGGLDPPRGARRPILPNGHYPLRRGACQVNRLAVWRNGQAFRREIITARRRQLERVLTAIPASCSQGKAGHGHSNLGCREPAHRHFTVHFVWSTQASSGATPRFSRFTFHLPAASCMANPGYGGTGTESFLLSHHMPYASGA